MGTSGQRHFAASGWVRRHLILDAVNHDRDRAGRRIDKTKPARPGTNEAARRAARESH